MKLVENPEVTQPTCTCSKFAQSVELCFEPS